MTALTDTKSVEPALVSDHLKGTTAILACPTYGPVDPLIQKKLRIAIMSCANHGLRWLGDASTDKVGFGGARNTAAQALLDLGGEAHGCMWVDSDIDVPAEAMVRLIGSAVYLDADVMSGVYHKKLPPFNPVIYHYDPKRQKFFELDTYEKDLIITPGGCGFGFVWTSYRIVKRISEMKDFDTERGGWFPDARYFGGFGEDLAFCYKVQQLGVPVHIDTGVQVGHQGQAKTFWRQDYLRAREEVKTGMLIPAKPDKWGLVG